jgi:carbon-monoxide dehydrogenase small subunit
MILSAKALLDETPNPSEAEIRHALAGNMCRCTGYVQIVEAVQAAGIALTTQGEVRPRKG